MNNDTLALIRKKSDTEIDEISLLQQKLLKLNSSNHDTVRSFINQSTFLKSKAGLMHLLCSIDSVFFARPTISDFLIKIVFEKNVFTEIRKHFSDKDISAIIKNINFQCFFHDNGFAGVPSIENHSEIVKIILNDPIIKSIREDNLDIFQSLLKSQVNVNNEIKFAVPEAIDFIQFSWTHASPIEIAAFYGSINTFKFLFTHKLISIKSNLSNYSVAGGNMEIINMVESNKSVIFDQNCVEVAIKYQRNDIIKYLLAKNKSFSYTIHSLFNCIRNYNLIVFREIAVSVTAQINEKEKEESVVQYVSRIGYTEFLQFLVTIKAFHIAAQNEQLEVLKLLSQIEKVDVNAKDVGSKTALHIAAEKNNTEVVEFLIKNVKGINLNDRTFSDKTPLHLAIDREAFDVVKLLCQIKGVDLNAIDIDKKTPLHYSVFRNCETAIKILLLHEDIDVNQKMKGGKTPLHIAAEKGFLNIIKLLCETAKNTIDVNIKDENGKTPLHYSIIMKNPNKNNIEIINFMLSSPKFNVRIGDESNLTPIHDAVKTGFIEAVNALIPHSDLNAKDNSGVLNYLF